MLECSKLVNRNFDDTTKTKFYKDKCLVRK